MTSKNMNFEPSSLVVRIKCRGDTRFKSNTIYNVHCGLLSQASTILAQKVAMVPGMPKIILANYLIHLDVSSKGFEVLAKWLYSSKIQYDENKNSEDIVGLLCEAYETGVTLGINSSFQDLVMDAIVICMTEEQCDSHYADDFLPQLIETFGKGSPGRQFIYDWLLQGKFDVSGVDDQDEEIANGSADVFEEGDAEFCLELANRLLLRRADNGCGDGAEPPWRKRCAYHVHPEPELDRCENLGRI